MKKTFSLPVLPAAALLATLFVLAACSSMSGSGTASAPTLSKERIAEIIAAPDRSDADRTNDIRRKPAEILAFIGIRPGMVALDLVAGGGYTTELVARAVGPTGKVYGQYTPPVANPPPPAPGATPRPAPGAMLATRAKNPVTSNIVPLPVTLVNPVPPEVANEGLDLVTCMFNYHDLGSMGAENRAAMNQALFKALKHGGMYVIADHSGRPGTGISESTTLHRMEQAFLQKEIEAAGFKLAAEGNFLRNPSDPRDKVAPEPPQPKDEFVLKFVKP